MVRVLRSVCPNMVWLVFSTSTSSPECIYASIRHPGYLVNLCNNNYFILLYYMNAHKFIKMQAGWNMRISFRSSISKLGLESQSSATASRTDSRGPLDHLLVYHPQGYDLGICLLKQPHPMWVSISIKSEPWVPSQALSFPPSAIGRQHSTGGSKNTLGARTLSWSNTESSVSSTWEAAASCPPQRLTLW